MVKKTVTWILVADGHRARILLNEGPGKGLKPAAQQEFVRALPPTRELGSDKPGRTQESGYSGRHSLEPRVDWHRHEKHLFAREMARVLDEAAARKEFDRLILVAPPQTLGELRAALAKATRAIVGGEIGKDLTHLPLGDLPKHFGDVIAV